jgi:hypothetical protein
MADLVMGCCASHAPMAAARESAPAEQGERFFATRRRIGDEAVTCDVQAVVMLAGNGTGELHAWMAVGGAMRGARAEVPAYEPIYPWINRMGVVLFDRATV